jgi:protein-S-isoprenylcysteine O-methyltransferase Ste14
MIGRGASFSINILLGGKVFPMRKGLAVLGSAVFFVLAPGIVAGLAPWWISRRGADRQFLGWPLRSLGAVLIAAGVLVLLDSFVRFALQGLGTPAPVFPTRHLVVTGLYRYVRNPMYVAVAAVILGQSLVLGNALVLGYGVLVWLAFHLFVLGYEEPALRKKYGDEYGTFCSHVPRWIPRLSPWRPKNS